MTRRALAEHTEIHFRRHGIEHSSSIAGTTVSAPVRSATVTPGRTLLSVALGMRWRAVWCELRGPDAVAQRPVWWL